MIPRVNLERSRKMQQLRQRQWERHAQCEMILRKKSTHVGLYCKEHGTWFKWVSGHDLDVMLDAGTEYQDETQDLTQNWIELIKED